MAGILVFEDNLFAQQEIQRTLARDGHEVFGGFITSLDQADGAIARAVLAGVTIAIVDRKLIGGDENDGIKIVEKLKNERIKSISYATNSKGMGADIDVGKENSRQALLNGVAQALNIFVQE